MILDYLITRIAPQGKVYSNPQTHCFPAENSLQKIFGDYPCFRAKFQKAALKEKFLERPQ